MTDDTTKKESPYLPRSWGATQRRKHLPAAKGTDPQDDAGEPEVKASPPPQASFLVSPVNEAPAAVREVEPRAPARLKHEEETSRPLADDKHGGERERDETDSSAEESGSLADDEQPRTKVIVAGIRFTQAGKIYHFESGDMDLHLGDWVIVKTEKGIGLGQVAVESCEKELGESQRECLRKIIRKAGKVDFDQKTRCCQREAEAHAFCLERIETLGLPMKLVSTECFFDGSKYVFYFTAEGRVDFRELVKQLVARFPVRIEMRQIGVRHEAKMTGGIASCGQELCCSRFLTDFRPVSVKMAKCQNLSLNPTKISGVCGRLMCCLAYEHDIYEDFKKGLPKVGKAIRTGKGEAVILKYNPLKETICVRLNEDTIEEIGRDEVLGDSAPSPQRKSDRETVQGNREQNRRSQKDKDQNDPERG